MKIIKQKAVREISNFICDACKKEACSHFKMEFGYGSYFDMEVIEGDFCAKCGDEFRFLILKKFKRIKPTPPLDW